MGTTGGNKKYTAADFHRYHSGTMSETDMHALEKLALEDPFLADALEGYAFTNTGEADIVAIKKILSKKEENKKSILIFLKNSVWVKVAAILVIMLGVYYFTNFRQSNDQPQLAKNEDKPESGPVTLIADSTPTYNSTVASNSGTFETDTIQPKTVQATTLKVTAPDKEVAVIQGTVAGNSTYTVSASASYSITTDSVHANNDDNSFDSKKEIKADSQERPLAWTNINGYTYNGQVVDLNGKPVPFATISAPMNKTGFATDSAGRFAINSYDTISTASIAALGYSTKQTKLINNVNQTIVLLPAATELSQVGIVTSKKASNNKERDSRNLALEGNEPGLNVTENIPVNGWENYKRYLIDSVKVPVSKNQSTVTGTVILSFILEKDGTPKKIKVEKSLSKVCDKEAIRLLTQGPKWNYKNNKRTILSINFK